MFSNRLRECLLHPCLAWIGPEFMTLTRFSVMAGAVIASRNSDCLPFVVCNLVGLVLAFACTTCFFLRMYLNCRARLDDIEANDGNIRKLTDQLEACERKLDACHSKEKKMTGTLMAIKKALECPILCGVPADPVITSTGYIYSLRAMNEYCWHNNGFYRCPNTRQALRAQDFMRCYPVMHACEEIRLWERV